MAIRVYCGIVLLLMTGCSPNSPGEVADRQSAMSDPFATADSVDSVANSSIDPKVKFEDVMRKLQEATEDQRFEQAAKLAEEALDLQPDNLELLANAIRLSQ